MSTAYHTEKTQEDRLIEYGVAKAGIAKLSKQISIIQIEMDRYSVSTELKEQLNVLLRSVQHLVGSLSE